MLQSRHLPIATLQVQPTQIQFRVTIDKLLLRFKEWVPVSELIDHWEGLNLEYRNLQTGSNFHGITCEGITFHYTGSKKEFVSKVVINPEHFANFEHCLLMLQLILSKTHLVKLKLFQVDVAFDILNKSPQWVRERIVFLYKRCLDRFVDDSFADSSINHGGKDFYFRLYNKLKLIGRKGAKGHYAIHSYPFITRIELSLSGKRSLPTQDVFRLKSVLSLSSFNPFKYVQINDFQFAEIPAFDELESRETYQRALKLLKLITLTEANGLHQARKILNSGQHFNRDYSPFLLNRTSDYLDAFYRDGIRAYFDEPAKVLVRNLGQVQSDTFLEATSNVSPSCPQTLLSHTACDFLATAPTSSMDFTEELV